MTLAKKLYKGLLFTGVCVVAGLFDMEIKNEEPPVDKRIKLYNNIMRMGDKFVAQKRMVKKTIGCLTFVTDRNGPAIWLQGHKVTDPLKLPISNLFKLAAYCNKLAADTQTYN